MNTNELAVVIVASYVLSVGAYPGGAPNSCCGSLSPDHAGATVTTGIAAQNRLNITSGKTKYKKGEKVNVKPDKRGKGMIIQARKANSTDKTPVGKFVNTDSSMKTIDCSATEDTITHKDSTEKEPTVEWEGPVGVNVTVVFWGTFVINRTIIDFEIESEPIEYDGTSGTTTGSGAGGVIMAALVALMSALRYL